VNRNIGIKTDKLIKYIRAATCILLLLVSFHTVFHAVHHFGEFILYVLTVLCCVAFQQRYYPILVKQRHKSSDTLCRVCSALLIILMGGAILLNSACYSDTVDYREKYCIVLGAPLSIGNVSKILTERSELAADFLTKDQEAVAVLTGGNSPYGFMGKEVESITTEGAYMAMVLTAKGIDPDRLYLEDRAVDTVSNFQNTMKVLESIGYSQDDVIVIITSLFHSYRVRYYAKKAGLVNFKVLTSYSPFIDVLPWYFREFFVCLYGLIVH